ncbi:hypothetical protein J7643_19115 [bacterium]|nr:hypothetical protein [bacterium]
MSAVQESIKLKHDELQAKAREVFEEGERVTREIARLQELQTQLYREFLKLSAQAALLQELDPSLRSPLPEDVNPDALALNQAVAAQPSSNGLAVAGVAA